jgi:large subunit ribosomal protein L21
MFAVIRTGGKQYRVAADDKLRVEKLAGDAGDTVTFSDVLVLGGEGEPKLGSPLVAGAAVLAEIVEQQRGDKVIIFKKRRRQNSKRRRGHRQEHTLVRITEILADASKAKPRKQKAAATEQAPATADDAGVEAAASADAGTAPASKPGARRARKNEAAPESSEE